MADIVQTAANVLKGTVSRTLNVVAGETIVAGDVLYKDTADGDKYKKAINSAATSAVAAGIALGGGGDGQPIVMLTSGSINPGGTAVVGTVYCVSVNAGKFGAEADVLANDYKTRLGIGTTAANVEIKIQVSGVAEP